MIKITPQKAYKQIIDYINSNNYVIDQTDYSITYSKEYLNISKSLQKIVLESPYWSYKFAQNIPGANIKKCQESANKDPRIAYYFATGVRDACKWSAYCAVSNTKYEYKLKQYINSRF